MANCAGLGTALGSTIWASNTLIFEAGTVSVSETTGYLLEAGYSAQTGAMEWIMNRTGGIYTPYTRLAFPAQLTESMLKPTKIHSRWQHTQTRQANKYGLLT